MLNWHLSCSDDDEDILRDCVQDADTNCFWFVKTAACIHYNKSVVSSSDSSSADLIDEEEEEDDNSANVDEETAASSDDDDPNYRAMIILSPPVNKGNPNPNRLLSKQ